MSLAQELKDKTAAVSFRKKVFAVKKRLDDKKRKKAEEVFHADERSLTASKAIIDVKDPAYKLVVSTIRRARRYWKSQTIAFPADRKIRLIRKDLVEQFDGKMTELVTELEDAVGKLCEEFNNLKLAAKKRLGELFSSSDYPGVDDLREAFGIDWWYPSVDPAGDLKELHPKVYEAEQARIAAKFEEAAAVAEQAMAAQLKELISGLVDRLDPNGTGKKKQLTPSAIKSLTDFVAAFRSTQVSTSEELESILGQAEHLTKGLDPGVLKKNPDQQGALFGKMSTLKQSLDSLVVDAPTRKITLEDEE